jgi:exopolysaccharide production protein ExoQ
VNKIEQSEAKSTLIHVLPLGAERAVETLPWLVGFYLSFRVFIMLLSVRWFWLEPESGVAVNLTLNYLLLGIVLFNWPPGTIGRLSVLLKLPPVRWVMLFLCFSCLSLLWSSTASLSAAVAFWGGMAADTAMMLVFLMGDDPQHVASSVMKGFVWGACLVAVIAWILPAQSDLRLGDEELLGPNQIGWVCGFALYFAQYLIRNKDGKWGIIAGFLAITLLRSLSKTAIVAVIISQVYLLLFDRTMSRRSKVWLVVGSIATIAVFWSLLSSYYTVYTTAGNSPETLTGRLGIWAYILDEAIQQPWAGHGFHSVWKVIPSFGEFEARHAHNEWLQQFYAYGVVGLVLLTGLYGGLWRYLRRLPKHEPMRVFFNSMILLVLVRGVTDTEPFDLSLPLWAITLIAALVGQQLELANRYAQPGPNLETLRERL